jgi:hypothetical protein
MDWRLREVQRLLGDLVSRAEYAARLESADHRFADLRDDFGRLDRKHDEDVKRLHERLDDHSKSHSESGLSWRQILWPMLGAGVATAASIAVQLVSSGGH